MVRREVWQTPAPATPAFAGVLSGAIEQSPRVLLKAIIGGLICFC